MSSLQDYAGGTRLLDTTDISLAERLAFERLLADLSVTFANLPSDRVIEETEHALLRLIEFLDFDRSSLGELSVDGGHFEILCSATRNGVEPVSRGPAPRLPGRPVPLPRPGTSHWRPTGRSREPRPRDRKSTRLNSSHT